MIGDIIQYMFEKNRLKKLCKTNIKQLEYFGISLWVPEDFYDRPVSAGSVLFHLESIKRGYQLHAIAGSRQTVDPSIRMETFYTNVTTSMVKLFGEDTYPVSTKSLIERKNRTITTEVYHYRLGNNSMNVYFMWIYFKKTEQYVLLYATGHQSVINSKKDEFLAVADTVTC